MMPAQFDRDCYAVLGVPSTASGEEIHAAYRRLARRFHPDLNGGDPRAAEHFKRVNAAYEILADPRRRRRYDALLARRRQPRSSRRARTASRPQRETDRFQRRGFEVRLLGLTIAVNFGATVDED